MRLIILSTLLFGSSLQATSFLLREEITQNIACSRKGLTKISLDEGEFTGVIIQDSLVEYHLINNGTQLIINALDEETPVVLVTSDGHTASIILTPTANLLENHLLGFSDKDKVPLILQRILSEETPKGFERRSLNQSYEKSGLKIQNQSLFHNGQIKIIKFTLKNLSEQSLKTQALYFPSASKILYSQDTLNPGESCHACAVL